MPEKDSRKPYRVYPLELKREAVRCLKCQRGKPVVVP